MDRKPKIYLDFLFLNSTNYFIMEIPNKEELQLVAFSHLSNIEFNDFLNFYKNWTAYPFFGSTVASDNPWRFRKNLLERI